MTMGDIYLYAGSGDYGLTFCAPIMLRGQFYAAICYDIVIFQTPI